MRTRLSSTLPGLGLALLLGLSPGLGACTETVPEGSAGASPSASATGGPAPLFVLSEDGLGGLGPSTPFDTAAVRRALPPGFAVELRSVETAQGFEPVVWALRDGLLVLEVFPAPDGRALGRIDVTGELAEGPGGARVGMTFAETGGAGMDCEPGNETLAGRAVCSPRRGGPVRFVYAHHAADEGEALPPADKLGNAILERLVWLAP